MSRTQDFILRVDRVGSFRLILSEEVILGGPDCSEETGVVRILAPLSNQHARVKRYCNGYAIEPLRGAVQLTDSCNQKKENLLVEQTYWKHNQLAMLSPEIGVSLHIVSPLCQSARLNLSQAHRLLDREDGLVLMDRMILLGPGKMMHIDCPHWEQAGALIYREGNFRFRLPVGLEGEKQHSGESEPRAIDETIRLNQHYSFEEIGFYLEG